MKTYIHWLLQSQHLDKVFQIEMDSFDDFWDPSEFHAVLAQKNIVGIVATDEDENVLGYAVYACEKGTIEVLDLAVARSHRRSGVGRELVAALIHRLTTGKKKRSRLAVAVRESNLPACAFFRACGLRATNVRHRPYDGTDDDGFVFEYRVPSTSPRLT